MKKKLSLLVLSSVITAGTVSTILLLSNTVKSVQAGGVYQTRTVTFTSSNLTVVDEEEGYAYFNLVGKTAVYNYDFGTRDGVSYIYGDYSFGEPESSYIFTVLAPFGYGGGFGIGIDVEVGENVEVYANVKINGVSDKMDFVNNIDNYFYLEFAIPTTSVTYAICSVVVQYDC